MHFCWRGEATFKYYMFTEGIKFEKFSVHLSVNNAVVNSRNVTGSKKLSFNRRRAFKIEVTA